MSDELFTGSAFEQIPGQMAMQTDAPVHLFFVTYELIDRDGYKLTRALNSFRAETPDGAAAQAQASAVERGLTAEIISVTL